jgi:glyoxylase-like metal-dependent hydrolase (beta-lactamase superfamily II)
MLVGDLRIDPVADGMARVPPSEAYTGVGDDEWAPHRELLAADGMLELDLGGFLVRGGDRIALVDCGLGPLTRAGYRGGRLLESLAGLGVTPADVTDLVFTHLHFDHVGWATQKGEVVFPTAVPRCDRRDWEHFVTGPDGGAARKLGPLAGRVEFWEPGATILPGVDVQHAPGHTPGSTIVVISSGTERALLLGDVVHCAVELLDEEWAGFGDVDPEQAMRTRAALIREIEGTDVPVAAAHFPGLRFGRLLRGEGRRLWVV